MFALRCSVVATALLLAAGSLCRAQDAASGGTVPGSHWVSAGPGGGGHQHYPSISPFDSNLYFVSCDMSGIYRSTDRGQQWRMDGTVNSASSEVFFHPTNPNIVYIFTGSGGEFNHGWRLSRSDDQGKTWKILHEYVGDYDTNYGFALALDPGRPNWMVAGMEGDLPGKILRSGNGGTFWQAPDVDLPKTADVLSLVVDLQSDKNNRTIYAGTSAGMYISQDDGRTWKLMAQQPGDGKLAHLATCQGKDGQITFYAISGCLGSPAYFAGGKKVFKSADRGKTWQDLTANCEKAMTGRGYRFRTIAVSNASPDVVYLSVAALDDGDVHPGTFKTTDGGTTWAYIHPGDKYYEDIQGPKRAEGTNFTAGWITKDKHFSWGWGGEASYLAVCPTDPNIAFQTDDGRSIGTTDGGEHWQELYTNQIQGNFWASRGMEVCNTYEIYFDPKNHDRAYLALTDIGFFRSDDHGKSWTFSMEGGKYRNTTYELAIDPENSKILYAANSDDHDIPEYKTIRQNKKQMRGGVAKSIDGGLSWTMVGEKTGLPNGAITSIILDPAGTADQRTVMVAILGYGIYKSVDSGQSWKLAGNGMDLKTNANTWRLTMGGDGAIYCAIAKNIEYQGAKTIYVGGTVYRSDDKAETWTRIGPDPAAKDKLGVPVENDFAQPWDIAASKTEPGVVYVAVFEDRHVGPRALGGIYKSADKGATWTRFFAAEEVLRVSLCPADPKIVYASTHSDGLYGTFDGGITWNKIQGMPFRPVQKVTIDPDDSNTIWVATRGATLFKGPARGEEADLVK